MEQITSFCLFIYRYCSMKNYDLVLQTHLQTNCTSWEQVNLGDALPQPWVPFWSSLTFRLTFFFNYLLNAEPSNGKKKKKAKRLQSSAISLCHFAFSAEVRGCILTKVGCCQVGTLSTLENPPLDFTFMPDWGNLNVRVVLWVASKRGLDPAQFVHAVIKGSVLIA